MMQPSSSSAENRLRGKSILVVEDDVLVGREIRAAVEEQGAEVIGPIAGLSAALDAIEDRAVDAAVLDVRVHGLEVFGLARMLKDAGVPIVFVSGGSASEVPRPVRSPFIRKPFCVELLLRTLGGIIAASPLEATGPGWRLA